jgi:hypothetical protein
MDRDHIVGHYQIPDSDHASRVRAGFRLHLDETPDDIPLSAF